MSAEGRERFPRRADRTGIVITVSSRRNPGCARVIFDGTSCVTIGTLNATTHAFTFSGSVGSGTVTSVGITAPATLLSTTVGGTNPVTGSGSIVLSWINQLANCFFGGPTSGGAAAPACDSRCRVSSYIPHPPR